MREELTNIYSLGPSFKNGKGGIASVLEAYNSMFSPFNFLNTTSNGSIRKILAFLKCLFYLPFLVLVKRVKIFHLHGGSNTSFLRKSILIILIKILGSKVIFHIHGGGFIDFYKAGNKRFIEFILKKSDLVIVLSEQWESFFEEEMGLQNVKIIRNVIRPPQNLKTIKEERPPIISFLFLGHIYQKKGIFDLVELIHENRSQLEGKLILHIGGGMFETPRLTEYIIKNDLQNLVKFHGWVSGDEKTTLFQECDVFILPSYAEGVPISIMEAMSYGLSVISTDVGGIPSLIDNGVNGLLIEPGNQEQLRKSIFTFIDKPELSVQFGKRNIERAKYFYPSTVKAELEAVYRDLL